LGILPICCLFVALWCQGSDRLLYRAVVIFIILITGQEQWRGCSVLVLIPLLPLHGAGGLDGSVLFKWALYLSQGKHRKGLMISTDNLLMSYRGGLVKH
jgi:hypothetical protein